MRILRFLYCGIILLSFVFVVPETSAITSKMVQRPIIKNVNGDVAVKTVSSDKWEPVTKAGYKLKNGSTIRTTKGTAKISCPDGTKLKINNNTTATISIANDKRVQIATAQGSVNVILGKTNAAIQLGPNQTIQEKYNPKTDDIDISCVKGDAKVGMSNGVKVNLKQGDVVTASPKNNSVKAQAGKIQVVKGKDVIPVNMGVELVLPMGMPWFTRSYGWTPGRYGYMTETLVTTEEYTYVDDTDATSTDEAITTEEKEETIEQEETESPAEEMQETESTDTDTSDSGAVDTGDSGGDVGGDSSGGDSGGDSGGGDSGGGGDGGGGGE